MTFLKRLRWTVILGVLFLVALPMYAQSQSISYGAYTIAALDANTPAAFYTFTAEAGDTLFVEAAALTGDLNPRVSILDAASATLALSADDPFQPGTRDARLTYRINTAGTYSILVEAENQSTGRYLLRLDKRDLPAASQSLALDLLTSATVSPDVPTVVYSVDSAQGTTISVNTPIQGLAYVAEIIAPDGQTWAVMRGGDNLQGGAVSVPANTGVYQVVVRSLNAGVTGALELSLRGAPPAEVVAAPQPTAVPAPVTEAETPAEEVAAPPPATEGEAPADSGSGEGESTGEGETTAAEVPARCNVSPSLGGVVIRQSPSTEAPAIASIPEGEFRYADGTDGAWIRLVGGGWVSSGVVELNGFCGSLPLVTADTPQSAAPAPAAPSDPNANPIGQRGG